MISDLIKSGILTDFMGASSFERIIPSAIVASGMPNDFILVEGARQHNLKGIHLKLPCRQLIVVTGVSGSGKSSLAFDTLYAEGQRRYIETFSPYARQFLDRMDKPNVDKIEGIPPAIAINQTNPVKTSRSTVGTMTELNDYLKLLFARAAQLHCRHCGQIVQRDSPDSIHRQLPTANLVICFPVRIPPNFTETEVRALLAKQGYHHIEKLADNLLEVVADRVQNNPANRSRVIEALETALKHGHGRVTIHHDNSFSGHSNALLRFSSDLHCAQCDIHYLDPHPNTFSFNSAVGACQTCRGFGRIIGIDYDLVVPDKSLTLAGGAIKPWQTDSYRECHDDLLSFARKRGVPVDVPFGQLTASHRQWVIEGEGRWEDRKWYGVKRFFDWLETKSYKMHVRVLLSKYRAYTECPDCHGSRLKPEALLWRLPDKTTTRQTAPISPNNPPTHSTLPANPTIHDIMLMPLTACCSYFETLIPPTPFDEAADLVLREIRARLRYLVDVGLGYLTLDRQSRTLSGGEVQRINLTTALGTSLVNTLFVLDEPSLGLHPRDIHRLIAILKRLRDAGNTLLVVEHDPDVIRAADRVLDLGPGPGERGGNIVFFGTFRQLLACAQSRTGQAMRQRQIVVSPRARQRRPIQTPSKPNASIRVIGAAQHNLKSIDVEFPLRQFVCVTGVSGSGKSTLVEDVLYRGLLRLKGKPTDAPGQHAAITGHEHIANVIMVDQSPIGRTARSNPASYVGAFDSIRKRFADQPLSRERGYTAGSFSFNSGTGRCPACSGSGFEHVEMQFLSDVYLRCPDCDGRRYRAETLEVRVHGKSIADVLELTVDDAIALFAEQSDIGRALQPLHAVGLGYVRLGQPVPTLSGGEAQRLKLAGYLTGNIRSAESSAKTAEDGNLFLFDEPTTGLHFDDIEGLMLALRELIAQGHSVVVVEHNLDVIRAADWIIDLGPGGGHEGGQVVCAGTPADLARTARRSHTGKHLVTRP